MLVTDIKNFDYVAVEVIENPGLKVTQIECGLFMGILTHSSNTSKEAHFIALQTAESAVRLYNLNEFNILSIEALSSDMNYLTVFRNTDLDQNKAVEILHEVVKEMGANNRLFDTTPKCELIDVDSYSNFPAHFLVNNTLSGSTDTNVYKPSSTKHTNYVPYTNKEPEKPKVLNFRRKGKLPEKTKLDKMREMVQALASGNIEMCKLPVIPCDVVESPPIKEATETSV